MTREENKTKDSKETLFVRNIGWDTTQDQFKEHMEQFGKVKYALLCRATGELDDTTAHRGTGFVRFENKADAESLLELS